jgi:hypothetical protein
VFGPGETDSQGLWPFAHARIEYRGTPGRTRKTGAQRRAIRVGEPTPGANVFCAIGVNAERKPGPVPPTGEVGEETHAQSDTSGSQADRPLPKERINDELRPVVTIGESVKNVTGGLVTRETAVGVLGTVSSREPAQNSQVPARRIPLLFYLSALGQSVGWWTLISIDLFSPGGTLRDPLGGWALLVAILAVCAVGVGGILFGEMNRQGDIAAGVIGGWLTPALAVVFLLASGDVGYLLTSGENGPKFIPLSLFAAVSTVLDASAVFIVLKRVRRFSLDNPTSLSSNRRTQ